MGGRPRGVEVKVRERSALSSWLLLRRADEV